VSSASAPGRQDGLGVPSLGESIHRRAGPPSNRIGSIKFALGVNLVQSRRKPTYLLSASCCAIPLEPECGGTRLRGMPPLPGDKLVQLYNAILLPT
jgi:hypothetical protein